MSQEQLGDALNITFQQVQKYERGSNRISASRLWDIGQILDVPVSFFFDDMSDETAAHSPRRMKSGIVRDEYEENPTDPMARRERSEEHTSELQSLMRISYAVFCLKKKTAHTLQHIREQHKTEP